EAARLLRLHAEAYARQAPQIRPLPGARELLAYLTRAGVPWTIATSGRLESARPTLEALGVGPEVPVVTRDMVEHAKPDPDLFLAAAHRPGAPRADAEGGGGGPAAPGRWASACSRAATARTSWSAPGRTASTRTPPTCWTTSMKLV